MLRDLRSALSLRDFSFSFIFLLFFWALLAELEIWDIGVRGWGVFTIGGSVWV